MRLLLLLTLVLPASSSDVSGNWTDCRNVGHNCQREQTFQLKADGEKLTGTVARRQQESTGGVTTVEIVTISDGKISGSEISFTTAHKTKGYLIIPPFFGFPHDRTWHYSYKGMISGDHIQLTRALTRHRSPVPVGHVCCVSASGKVKGQELILVREKEAE